MKYLLIALLIMGCSEIKDGTVIEKFYEPYRQWTSLALIGKIMVPQIHHDDEDFVIIIQKKVDGEIKTARYELSKERYEKTNIGDYVRFE